MISSNEDSQHRSLFLSTVILYICTRMYGGKKGKSVSSYIHVCMESSIHVLYMYVWRVVYHTCTCMNGEQYDLH